MYLILGSTRPRFMESHSDQHHFDVHLVPPLGNFRFYWSKWMGKHGLSRDFLVADRIHSAANRLLALQLLPKIHQSDKECDHHWCHSVQCQINCCSTTTEFRQPFSFVYLILEDGCAFCFPPLFLSVVTFWFLTGVATVLRSPSSSSHLMSVAVATVVFSLSTGVTGEEVMLLSGEHRSSKLLPLPSRRDSLMGDNGVHSREVRLSLT